MPTRELTDNEYFKLLYKAESDPSFIKIMEEASRMSDKMHATAVAEGCDASKDLFRDALDPKQSFEGAFTKTLRQMALRLLGRRVETVKETRIFLLPSRSLNGFASQTPSGTPFIVLNQDIVMILGFYTRWFSAFYSWHDTNPYCRDHSQAEFGEAIVRLAYYATTGESRYINGIKALNCPSIPDWKGSTYSVALLMELAILLHEFGHLILGHLQTALHYTLKLDRGMTLDALKLSRDQEFEADAFAFRVLREANQNLTPTDIAYAMGLLFNFFELCHRLSPSSIPEEEGTHPPPAKRWGQIRNLADIDKFPGSLAFHLDDAFDVIFRSVSV